MAAGTEMEKTAQPKVQKVPLTAALGTLGTRARVRWTGMRPGQRAWAAGTAVFIAALCGLLVWYAMRPDWRVLYAGMDSEDARQMGQTLTQAQIPFDVTADGAGIRVPASQLDKARLATSSKGGARSGRMGFELFDRPNWVGSEFDEQVNYQRALEGELEHTVASLSDIESARVHLVLPHDSLFRDQERSAKASVVLKLRHRSLADGEPDAIRTLVASAVDGLLPDRVALVDAAGNVPLGPKTANALRMSAEQALEEKLVATLEPVTGRGNVRASVTVDYDGSASEETKESYDPAGSVTLSMQRTEQAAAGQPVAAGVPGTASNVPNAQAVPVYPRENTAPQSSKTESSTYGVSRTVLHSSDAPGRLRRLTAAIVVNDRLVSAAAKNKAAVWQPRSNEEIRNLTALAQAAVGFEQQRGDLLTVEDFSFDENRPVAEPPLVNRVLSHVQASSEVIKYVSLLLGFMLLTAFGVRPALRSLAKATPVQQLPAGSARAAVEAPHAPERTRAQDILEQVSGHVKREPAQSSRLLQSWLHTER